MLIIFAFCIAAVMLIFLGKKKKLHNLLQSIETYFLNRNIPKMQKANKLHQFNSLDLKISLNKKPKTWNPNRYFFMHNTSNERHSL